eukprot:6671478-Pyramimonas_sp.AAC.1
MSVLLVRISFRREADEQRQRLLGRLHSEGEQLACGDPVLFGGIVDHEGVHVARYVFEEVASAQLDPSPEDLARRGHEVAGLVVYVLGVAG